MLTGLSSKECNSRVVQALDLKFEGRGSIPDTALNCTFAKLDPGEVNGYLAGINSLKC